MKKFVLRALLGVALAAPAVAFAMPADHNPQAGHYEWRSIPQFGPRASRPARQQVWVADATQMANCDCDMMKMGSAKAADCMTRMQAIASPVSGHRAG